MKNITLTPSKNKNGTYGLCNLEDSLVFYKDNIKYSDNLDNIDELYFNCSPVILVDKKIIHHILNLIKIYIIIHYMIIYILKVNIGIKDINGLKL